MTRDRLRFVPPPPRRRRLLPRALMACTAVAAAAACAPGRPAPQGEAAAAPSAPAAAAIVAAPTLGPPQPGDTLRDPLVISSVPVRTPTGTRNILDVEMHAIMAYMRVPAGQVDSQGRATFKMDTIRTWKLTRANGVAMDTMGYPGPTFQVSPGDSVRILLVNDLPRDTPACEPYPASDTNIDRHPECFHGPNSTNIHFHGFHVSPEDYADNVLLEIDPGERHQYAFGIPMNQSPGTHWYHPHKHGSVALQVSNGMSGAFLVRGGGLDSITRYPVPMRDRLIAIQQIGHQVNLVRDTAGDPPYAINGQVNAVIVMQPGEVQRWRIVNENVAKPANYSVFFDRATGPDMYDIARDGVQYAPANYDHRVPDDSLLVAPGNRLDLFVQAPATPGWHSMRLRPLAEDDVRGVGRRERARVQARRPGALLTEAQIEKAAEDTLPLLRVYVPPRPTRSGYVTQLPATLPPLPSFLANLQDPGGIQEHIVFVDAGLGGQGNPLGPPLFFLGNAENPFQQFNPDSNFLYLPLNATQNWRVENRSPNQLPHPFHIHINPFQVMRVHYPRGKADSNHLLYEQLNEAAGRHAPVWLDVIPLPQPVVDPATNRVTEVAWVEIRQRYENYTGAYVIHCHILGHEERGMMQRVTVTPGGRPVPAAQTGAGSQGHRH